jgi:quercetin 2,3-dioxygenase
MNTQGELRAAFRDYQETQFGGWDGVGDPVFDRSRGRFATFRRGGASVTELPPSERARGEL